MALIRSAQYELGLQKIRSNRVKLWTMGKKRAKLEFNRDGTYKLACANRRAVNLV